MTPIAQILLDIVKNLFAEAHITSVTLDTPPKNDLGDFAFNVFPLAKSTKLAPPVIAEKVAEALRSKGEYFKDVSVMGGYVNFFLKTKAWVELFTSLSTEQKSSKNETVVVDYIGANAGKPLHIGHICTPSIGQAIINTHEYLGYNVISDSHFGDWGGIFGKLIYAYKMGLYGKGGLPPDEMEIYAELNRRFWLIDDTLATPEQKKEITIFNAGAPSGENDEEYTRFILALYVVASFACDQDIMIDEQCRSEFKKLSNGDRTNAEIWQKFTANSISVTQKQLQLFNIHTKYNIGESFYEGLNLPRPNKEDYPDLEWNMKDIVQELVEKKIATKNEDGSVGVVFPEETKIPSCVLQKKDGTGLYLTSDLAAIKYRLHNWKPSKIVYCVDSRQQLHLRQAFTIAKMAWSELESTELFHAFNGFIKLKEGAMSTRKGTVIFLSDLISEGFNRTETIIAEKGQSLPDSDIQAIAIGGIKYSYLAQDREKDIVFDWDKALNLEGNSGPYIQYAYVRAKNILEKASKVGSFQEQNLDLSEYDRTCLRRLAFFEKSVTDSASKYKPHILAGYCYELAVEFNSFYVHTPKILEEQDENFRNFRLSLIEKITQTLSKGFELLAIPMPEKM